MDSQMVAEDDGRAVHPSLSSHEYHCPGGSTSVGSSMSKQEISKDNSVEGTPSCRVRVRQVLDARHLMASGMPKAQQGKVDHQSTSCEAPSNARAKAKLWTKFQAPQATMDSLRRKKIKGQTTFQ
jgi:hypothetical protein